jgi:probable phosphoglycerate mutase
MQTVTRIVAIRHGETAWNVDTRIQGHLDIPLNATGRWQASRMAEALADEAISAVYSSDLSRALETAEALGAVLGLSVVTDDRLRERADAFRRWHSPNRSPGTFARKTRRWTDESRIILLAAFVPGREHPGQTIAVVAHGGVMDCLYRAATRLDLQARRSWTLGNASINRLLHTGEGLTLVGWSDTRHLEDAALDETADGGTTHLSRT